VYYSTSNLKDFSPMFFVVSVFLFHFMNRELDVGKFMELFDANKFLVSPTNIRKKWKSALLVCFLFGDNQFAHAKENFGQCHVAD
jgi:hypothetical protein